MPGIHNKLRPRMMSRRKEVEVDLSQLIRITMFTVAAITTRQPSATFAIIPVVIALGLSPATVAAM